jgi:hypothetical protein
LGSTTFTNTGSADTVLPFVSSCGKRVENNEIIAITSTIQIYQGTVEEIKSVLNSVHFNFMESNIPLPLPHTHTPTH